MKKKTKLALGGAVVTLALLASGAAASGTSPGGNFWVQATDFKFTAKYGLDGATKVTENPGGENPGGGGPGGENPGGGGPAEPDTSKIVDTMSCDGVTTNITQKMIDFSDANKKNPASAKAYPGGGWKFLLSGSDLDAFFGPYSSLSPKLYAFSMNPTIKHGSSWKMMANSVGDLTNSSGPAMAYSLAGGAYCGYDFAENGKANRAGDAPTSVFHGAIGQASETKIEMFAKNGTMLASNSKPGYIKTSKNDTDTIYIRDGISVDEFTSHMLGDWFVRDRGSQPGRITEDAYRENGTPVPNKWFTTKLFPREIDGYTSYMDRDYYGPDGEKLGYSSKYSEIVGEGDAISSKNANVKPKNRLDGPSLINYNTAGEITNTEYAILAPDGSIKHFTTKAEYESAGGKGWIGMYQLGNRTD